MNKKAQQLKIGLPALLLIIGALIYFGPGLLSSVGGQAAEPVKVEVTGACDVATTTLTMGPQYNKFAPATKTSAEHHHLILDGVDEGVKNDGTTKSASPGQVAKLYYAINSTVYYAAESNEFTIPCAGAVSTSAPDAGNVDGLYQDGNGFSVTVYNDDGDAQSGEGVNNQSWNAGDTKNMRLKLSGENKKAFSPYAPINMICDYNKTAVTDITVTPITSGATASAGELLSQHTQETIVNRASEAFKIANPDGVGLIGNEVLEYTLAFEGDSTYGGGTAFINCTFYDADWYQNTDNGEFELKYEDNDNADVGFAADKQVKFTLV